MSEETKNPLIESFLKLHELVGGTYQDTLNPAERARRAQFSTPPVPAAIPPRPAIDTAPQPQPNMALQRQQSGDVAPKIDNSASMNRAKTDYQTRVAGVERQNPILTPGKLESGNLQMGSRGDSVKELQRKLGIKDDGIFGKDTAAALKSFQQRNNLKVDAVYGRQSASAMNKQSGMNALKKENPVGAYVSSQTVKPMSPMAGQGSSKNIARPSANISTLKRTGPMPISGNQGNFYTPVKSGSDLDKIANSDTTFIQNNKPIGSQTPMGALTKLAGQNAIEKLKQQRLNQSYEEPEMTNKLIEAFMKLQSTNSSNLFNEAKKAKKLDPVGKEDEDIDNDGDKDKSDSYLHNRRKAIKAAMKEAASVKVDPYSDGMTPREMGLPPPGTAKKVKPGNSKVIQTGPNSSTVTKSTNEEVEHLDEAKKTMLHPGLGSGTIHSGVELHTAGDYAKDKTKVWVVNHKKSSDVKSVHAQNPHLTPDEAKKVSGHINNAAHPFGSWSSHGNTVVQGGLPHAMSHWTRKIANGLVNKHHTDSLKEEVEQLDELKKAALMAVRNRASGRMMDDPSDEKAYKVEKQASKRLKKITDAEKEESSKRAYKAYKEEVEELDENDFLKGLTKKQRSRLNAAVFKAGPSNPVNIEKKKSDAEKEKTQFYNSFKRPPVKEEVEFSEAELEHIAAILEANPIAPVPDDYSGAAGGVSKRDLSDETVAEEEMKRGRGRPKGRKSGSKHGSGGDSTVETKNLAAQIRFSRPSNGNFTLKHPTTGVTKSVPAKAATEFYNKYTAAEKPAQKQAHHDEFLAKHFGSSEKPKTGITLPSMPKPRS